MNEEISAYTPRKKIAAEDTECNICRIVFNCTTNLPLIICSNHHSLCSKCLLSLRNELRCPFCRDIIDIDKISIKPQVNEFPTAQLSALSALRNFRDQLRFQYNFQRPNNSNSAQANAFQIPMLTLAVSILYLLTVASLNQHLAVYGSHSAKMDSYLFAEFISLRGLHLYLAVMQVMLLAALVLLILLQQKDCFGRENSAWALQVWYYAFLAKLLVFGIVNLLVFHLWIRKYHTEDVSTIDVILTLIDTFIVCLLVITKLGEIALKICLSCQDQSPRNQAMIEYSLL